jgi:predicted RNA-binding protein YlqC (UPF0109 family)
MNAQYSPLFRRFAEGIIYNPAKMDIRELGRGEHVTLFVKVHAQDIGILCGKQGQNIKAFQALFKEMARRRGQHVRIAVDKFGERISAPDDFLNIQSWDRSQEVVDLVKDTLAAMQVKTRFIDHMDQNDTTVITIDSDLPGHLFEALETVIRAWGKSLGRRIIMAKPEQVKVA